MSVRGDAAAAVVAWRLLVEARLQELLEAPLQASTLRRAAASTSSLPAVSRAFAAAASASSILTSSSSTAMAKRDSPAVVAVLVLFLSSLQRTSPAAHLVGDGARRA